MTNDDRSARDVLADVWERWHAESLARLLERPAADFAEVALALLADAGFHVVKDEPCETCGDSGEVVVESPWPTADVLRPCPACSGEGR